MTDSSTGKSPIVVVPAPKTPIAVAPSPKFPIRPITKQPINLQATKGILVGALRAVKGYESASDKIEEASFSLAGNTLEIQTNLSAAMLPLLFDAGAMHLLQSAVVERGRGDINVKLSPAPSVAVSAPFKRLADSAARLNTVSDQLTKQVEQIDAALKRLNLGVAAWVTISESEDEDGNWSQEQLGYVRIGSRWGMALKSYEGMRGDPNPPDETFSAFADAPRQLRIRAVELIPKLIDQLSTEAEAMIAKLSPKVDEISELTLALQTAPEAKK